MHREIHGVCIGAWMNRQTDTNVHLIWAWGHCGAFHEVLQTFHESTVIATSESESQACINNNFYKGHWVDPYSAELRCELYVLNGRQGFFCVEFLNSNLMLPWCHSNQAIPVDSQSGDGSRSTKATKKRHQADSRLGADVDLEFEEEFCLTWGWK